MTSLIRSKSGLLLLGAFALVSVFLWNILFAQAVEGPQVTTNIYTFDGAHATTTQASIGTLVHAHVSLASTSATTTIPGGTVNFNRYANTICSGTPAVEANVALVNGSAESSGFGVPPTGLSYRVNYNGDATSTPSQGACTSVVATAPNATITTSLSTTTAIVGTSVFSSATLNNATANASGTVAYTVYTNNSCTNAYQGAGVKTVTNSVVPNSDSVHFGTPGTYWWRAVYSGDTLNAAATSTCSSGMLSILATSTPPGHIVVDKVTIPAGATTTFSFNAGGAAYADFSLADGSAPNNQALPPGTYSISENTKAGWKLTSVMCSRNNATSTTYTPGTSITLNSGDTVACTFTNTQATSTPPGGGHGHDHDKDHDDKGKHKGWIFNLPFGILKKVWNGDFIPPGIQKKWEDRIDHAREHKDEDWEKNKHWNNNDDNDNDDEDEEEDDDSELGSSIKNKINEMKEKVKKSWDD